jgi:hypothetical protein
LRKEFDLWPPITSKGFFSYSASSALSSAGLTSARKPLISKKKSEIYIRIQGMWRIGNNNTTTHLDQQTYVRHPKV